MTFKKKIRRIPFAKLRLNTPVVIIITKYLKLKA